MENLEEKILRPTYTEIDLNIIRNNYNKIKDRTRTPVMPVVKANAYGHGAVRVAKVLQEEEAELLGVATIEEAIELKDFPNSPISSSDIDFT